MTEGPWWVDLTAVSGAVVAMSIILRMAIIPGAKRIWQAIVAAPQLAAGVGRLVELLETDILNRVEKLEVRADNTDRQLANIDVNDSAFVARLNAHDQRADSIEVRMGIVEYLTGTGKKEAGSG